MLTTANRSVDKWGGLFDDAVVATATLDRRLHYSHMLTITVESYRLWQKRRAQPHRPLGPSILWPPFHSVVGWDPIHLCWWECASRARVDIFGDRCPQMGVGCALEGQERIAKRSRRGLVQREVATPEECAAALQRFADVGLRGRDEVARIRAAGLGSFEGRDLLNEAITGMLEGRR